MTSINIDYRTRLIALLFFFIYIINVAPTYTNTMTDKKKFSFTETLKRFYDFAIRDVFKLSENSLTYTTRLFVRLLKKIVLAVRGFFEDDLMFRASVLTYYTLLAIVPIFAIILAIGKGFGLQSNIEQIIYSTIGTQHELTPTIMQFVNNYLNNAQGGFFVGVGIIILLWSVVSMFRQVEYNFNKIWNIKKNRPITKQFSIYLTILILIPIFAISSNGLSNLVETYINSIADTTVGKGFMPIYHFLLQLTPYIVYWLLFTIIFIIIPNTKVRFVDALFAGVITGTLFMILKYFYVSGMVSLSKYNAVYGSFAAIPLLLFWVNLSWLITLLGAELAYVSQNLIKYNFEYESKNISRRYSDYTLLIVMKIIIDRFKNGDKPASVHKICSEYNLPIRIVQDHIDTLIDINLISEISTNDTKDRRYQPAIDINQITVQMLMERMQKFGSENFKIEHQDKFQNLWDAVSCENNNDFNKEINTLIKDL